ncbi:MAG: hypothetical protein Q8P44_01700, partial [Dehalococcoidia bacterium]|nr:hypothetical protein [Dehalococcoidia bacterium]
MKLIEESKNTKTRVSRCDLLIQHAQALLEYERKGIPLNPSPSQLLSQYTAIRAQLADEEKNDYFALMEKIERARSQQRYYQA